MLRKATRSLAQKLGKFQSKMSSSLSTVWPNPTVVPPQQLSQLTPFAKQQLEQCTNLVKPSTKAAAVDLDEFMQISEQFPIPFPIDTCRVKTQPTERRELIRGQIASAYPIVHELTLVLLLNFLEHKQKYGNAKELSVYGNLSLTDFVQRLLDKRCAYFFGGSDTFKLLSGQRGSGGFEQIGDVEKQRSPLLLDQVLSYDEIKLAALLYVSTHSEFINNGDRSNAGVVEQNKTLIEREGVIMGMIGARFERDEVMEYQDIIITPRQNTEAKGYGYKADKPQNRVLDYRRLWRDFYEEPQDFRYTDVPQDASRFLPLLHDEGYLDARVMSKRYAISFDCLLLEAEARAAAAGKLAYIHVVGFGLGVWKILEEQERIFLSTFEQRLRALSTRLLHVGDVHFSWFHLKQCDGIHDGAFIKEPTHPQGGIKVRLSVRNPNDKLKKDQLLLVTYAWDGNALPGNEFWANMLVSTGDPAAACSTLITELQNSHINKQYMSGNNLHVASMEHGVLHIADYAERLLHISS
ncbi:uncharacterized protein LOC117578270 [Drosophila albomicans]|uniref:Uncharacterized protein LOC117578270 n=1 Tax=Drosophila albomicans TaxID=7291 RepID=A0A6P8Y1D6_DROAB|nr:uncharacterized protein LOC117578270 [Drosophila albomicans]